MLKLRILAVLFISSCFIKGLAQEKKRDYGFIFLLGPTLTYQLPNNDIDNSYNEGRISWQMDGQLGFISTRKQTNRGNMLLAFGSAGNANNMMLEQVLESSIYANTQFAKRDFNLYHSVEGGMIIMKLLRLSGGVGKQYFTHADTEEQGSLQYYVGTGGLNFDFGAVNLGFNAIFLTGGDLEKSVVRLSSGFLVKF